MPLFASIDPIKAQAENEWTDAQTARAISLLNGILAWIARHAPCLAEDNPDGADEARMIVSEAILRAIAPINNVASEGIGPSSVTYIDRAALPTLTRGDEAKLMALCPRSARRRYGTVRTTPGYLPGRRGLGTYRR